MLGTVLLVLIGLFFLIYRYMTRNYGYFRKHGVPEVPSSFPFGSDENWKVMTGKASFALFPDPIYEQYKKLPIVGYIVFSSPVLVIHDLDLIKRVLIKDFDHFADRREIVLNEDVNANKLFMRMVSFMKGEKWKKMRNKMSPVFTSGKLKVMSKMINQVGKELVLELEKKSSTGEEFNAKEIFARFMSDAIASCGFGIQTNSFKNPDSEFRKMVNKAIGGGQTSPIEIMKFLVIFNLPWLGKLLKLSFLSDEVNDFFYKIIKETLDYRKSQKIRRNDFVDLTMDALKDEMKYEVEPDQFEMDAEIKVTDSSSISEDEQELHLIANLLVLFFGGFDNSSTTITICTYYLAKHPDIQERLYNEINDNIENAEDIDYNSVQALPYLDMFVHETLRSYVLSSLERKCTIPYKVPGTDFTIPEGMMVQIPAGAIMKDEEFFPNPETFNPENFSPENKAKRNPYTFLAFGQGPRNCIGMRFALMNIKLCVVRLLKDFEVIPAKNLPEKLEHDPQSPQGLPKGGVNIKVKKRSL